MTKQARPAGGRTTRRGAQRARARERAFAFATFDGQLSSAVGCFLTPEGSAPFVTVE